MPLVCDYCGNILKETWQMCCGEVHNHEETDEQYADPDFDYQQQSNEREQQNEPN